MEATLTAPQIRSSPIARNAPSRAGTGFSDATSSFDAGAEAAQEAMRNGNIEGRCQLALLFTTSRHHPEAFAAGVRSITGAAAVFIGGCGVGFITNTRLGYDGYQSAVLLFQSTTIQVEAFLERSLASDGEYATGLALGRQIGAAPFAGEQSLLLFYDAVNRTSGKLKMTMGTTFIAGLYDALPQMPTAAGGGLTGDMQFGKSFQWLGSEVLQNSAFALRFSGAAKMHTTIMHGCMPASAYHTITKADGSVVLEIDGEPALQFVERTIGESGGLRFEDYGFFLTIGINQGNPYAPFDTSEYSNCMCVNVDKKRGGLVMVENNLQAGTQIQLMRRSLEFNYIYQATGRLLDDIHAEGRRPVMAFYVDCAGRAAYYLGSDKEEAAEVQKSLGADVPLFGLYSGVELAKVGNRLQPLDWTGVLAIVSE